MAIIDIPHIRIPFVDENNRLTQPAYQFLYFLWQRTGGHQDMINQDQSPVVVTSVNYLTTRNVRLICTAALTVTLDAVPFDGQVVEIKRTNGLVTVLGNGKNIDADTQVILDRDFVGVQLFFSTSIDTWVIV